MQPLGCAGKARFLGNGDEIAQAAYFHDTYIVSELISFLYWQI
jgi:hypothetical protein